MIFIILSILCLRWPSTLLSRCLRLPLVSLAPTSWRSYACRTRPRVPILSKVPTYCEVQDTESRRRSTLTSTAVVSASELPAARAVTLTAHPAAVTNVKLNVMVTYFTSAPSAVRSWPLPRTPYNYVTSARSEHPSLARRTLAR